MNRTLNILIAPLDWGLGHTTRCIPLIRNLLDRGCRVTLAAEGTPASVLAHHFPGLTILPLRGYGIRYSKNAFFFRSRILLQVPAILSAISRERKWLTETQEQHHFDLVISDNRYGLKIPGLYSVIMTHQLQVQTGSGPLADRFLRKIHYRILEQFDACWVVDQQGEGAIGGRLSQPEVLPANARYIGTLSQFEADSEVVEEKLILVLLSGPEPMRSQLQAKLISQIVPLVQYKFVFVAGSPAAVPEESLPAHIDYYPHLHTEALRGFLHQAALVICRSGYSTLMDLQILKKRALLIPTPGQSEQEYLAAYLQEKGWFLAVPQSRLSLLEDIGHAMQFPGFAACESTHTVDMLDIALDNIFAELNATPAQ